MSSPSQPFNNNGQRAEAELQHSQLSSSNNNNSNLNSKDKNNSSNSAKATGRVRSACNACHQSKIRCSGGAPCQPCRESMFSCTYSPGRRLGRPKGSKNKRAVQHGHNKQKQPEEPEPLVEDSSNNNNGGDRASTSGSVPPPLTIPTESSMDMDYDLDESSTSALLEDDFDFDQNAMMGSVFGSMRASRGPLSLGTKTSRDANAPGWVTPLSSPTFHGQSLFDGSDIFKGTGVSAFATHHPSLTPIDPALASLFQPGSSQQLSEPSSAVPSKSSTTGGGPSGSPTTARVPSAPPLCSCIQQHARLVYELGTLREAHDKATDVECVLMGVQLAKGPWQGLLQCPWGLHSDHHQEAFLLFSLSVRVLLSTLQKVQSSVTALSRPGTRAGMGSSERDVGLGGLASGSTASSSSLSLSGDVDLTRVLVGGFEVTGDTKLEVISVLIKGALESLLSVVSHQYDGRSMADVVDQLPPYFPNGSNAGENGASESPISTRTSVSAEAAQLSSQLFNMPHLHQAPDTGSSHIDAAANDIQALLNQLA